MNGTRKPATMIDSKYKVEDGFQIRYFHSKAKAIAYAKSSSSMCTAIVCMRRQGGQWLSIQRYRFGKVN